MGSVVRISHLSRSFGSTKAVDDVSFSVNASEIFSFLGANGAGKTTTIRLMMDFLKPDKCEVKLFGLHSIAQGVAATKRLSKIIRRHGGREIIPAEVFYAAGKEGPLEKGEFERARTWTKRVLSLLR